MSIFESPVLKRESIDVRGQEIVLYELSALRRCSYLELVSPDDLLLDDKGKPVPGEDEDEGRTLKRVIGRLRGVTEDRLWLVAYSMAEPGVDPEDIYDELAAVLPGDEVNRLWLAASELSGLSDGGEEQEPGKSEPCPEEPSPAS